MSDRPLPDLIANRYRVVSRLGVGGMGVVYKALDTQLNRAVAVKALEDRRLLMPGSTARLRTEALAAASLDHPYVCKVYELVETPLDTFIVMEFVEGETLASMLKRGPLPLLQVLQLGREIAEGLANAHARGLVHRDVKPSNVMVTTHGHVKLLDFGVAGADVTSMPADRTHTHAQALTLHAGTPQYMAPEHAAGQAVSARADLFSLGIVLYECLTGQLPFSGNSTFDYVRNVMQATPRRLDRIAPDTPADLVDLVERCLEKSPIDRPESADVVVRELQRLSDALTSAGGSVRTARQARSGRTWRLVAVGAIAALAVALGWRYIWRSGSAPDAPRQTHAFVTSAARDFGSRISPDGQWVAFMAAGGGVTQVMLQQIDGGDPRPVTLERGTPGSVLWSPDGRQIACVLEVDNQLLLQIYPAFFGGTSQLTLPIASQLSEATLLRWLDRSIYVEVLDPRAVPTVSLRRIDLDGGTTTNLSANWKIDGRLDSLDLRPDGRAVAFVTTRDGQEDLFTANVDGSGITPLTTDHFFERHPLWSGRGDRVIVQSNRGGQLDLWEIDARTKLATPLTSGEMEKIAESTSADGSVISFRRLSREARLWRWEAGGQADQQLTQDALSDYAPSASIPGGTIAFQRAQAIPSRGFTIIDAKIFVGPFDGRAIGATRTIADGFSPMVSPDGRFLSYLRLANKPARAALELRNLSSGVTNTVSEDVALPIFSNNPVGWIDSVVTWTPGSAFVYFISVSDVQEIRRVHVKDPTRIDTLFRAGANEYLRDLQVSDDGKLLAFLTVPTEKAAVTLSVIDLASSSRRTIASFESTGFTGIYGRGWVGGTFVVVRRIDLNPDSTGTVEVYAVEDTGARKAGTIPTAYLSTAKLHAARGVVYITRLEKGSQNAYECSLATGKLTAITKNTLPGVAFSGFHPAGPGALIGVREERREDLWLIQPATGSRSGNPAGR